MIEMALAVVSLIVIILLVILLTFVKRIDSLIKNRSDEQYRKIIELIKENGKNIKEEFIESRKELRTVNYENRKEVNDVFKNLQDTLLNRIYENINIQKEQLDAFSKGLGELSEKLIIGYNDFKNSIEESFQRFTDASSGKHGEFIEKTNKNFIEFDETIRKNGKDNRQELNIGLNTFGERFSKGIKDFTDHIHIRFNDFAKQQSDINQQSKSSILEVKETIEKQLKAIREDNAQQLLEMRKTVDEKLQNTLEKRLGESFKQVSERLELVHRGLGEMQTLAAGVGDLKKVLANVKTRGILGEYQLGNILEQLLTPEQYARNVSTKKGSQANVEYAIKLPGKKQDEEVWIPIDSKFPLENYNILIEAYEEGNRINIEKAQKALLRSIDSFAKDIRDKYLDPPHTTDFAVMFLPVEGLYAEVLRHPGLFEKLQNNYHITITGPTTLSAILNSLQMGFRTLALQKRSSEVWKVLSAVKTEFSRFSEQLAKVHSYLGSATTSLEKLQTTRTNVIERKLKSFEALDHVESKKILSLPDNE